LGKSIKRSCAETDALVRGGEGGVNAHHNRQALFAQGARKATMGSQSGGQRLVGEGSGWGVQATGSDHEVVSHQAPGRRKPWKQLPGGSGAKEPSRKKVKIKNPRQQEQIRGRSGPEREQRKLYGFFNRENGNFLILAHRRMDPDHLDRRKRKMDPLFPTDEVI